MQNIRPVNMRWNTTNSFGKIWLCSVASIFIGLVMYLLSIWNNHKSHVIIEPITDIPSINHADNHIIPQQQQPEQQPQQLKNLLTPNPTTDKNENKNKNTNNNIDFHSANNQNPQLCTFNGFDFTISRGHWQQLSKVDLYIPSDLDPKDNKQQMNIKAKEYSSCIVNNTRICDGYPLFDHFKQSYDVYIPNKENTPENPNNKNCYYYIFPKWSEHIINCLNNNPLIFLGDSALQSKYWSLILNIFHHINASKSHDYSYRGRRWAWYTQLKYIDIKDEIQLSQYSSFEPKYLVPTKRNMKDDFCNKNVDYYYSMASQSEDYLGLEQFIKHGCVKNVNNIVLNGNGNGNTNNDDINIGDYFNITIYFEWGAAPDPKQDHFGLSTYEDFEKSYIKEYLQLKYFQRLDSNTDRLKSNPKRNVVRKIIFTSLYHDIRNWYMHWGSEKEDIDDKTRYQGVKKHKRYYFIEQYSKVVRILCDMMYQSLGDYNWKIYIWTQIKPKHKSHHLLLWEEYDFYLAMMLHGLKLFK